MTPAGVEKTIFRKRAESYQWRKGRTRSEKVQLGLVLSVGGGIVSILVYFFPGLVGIIGRWVPPAVAPPVIFATVVLVRLCCLGAVIWGLVKIGTALASKVKFVRCPRCQQSSQVFVTIRTFMCPNCGLLMLIGEGNQSEVRLSTCAYCGLGTGTATDCASFRCSNCGVSRTGLATPGINPVQPCPGCGQPMPREALCCFQCGCETNRAYQNGQFAKGVDMDWLIGKDHVGHCQFARSLLNHLVVSAEEARTMDELVLRWVDMEVALVSIEEAGSSSPGYSVASKLLPSVEHAYLGLLTAELRIIQSNRNLTKKPRVLIRLLSNICGLTRALGVVQACDRGQLPWRHRCESRTSVSLSLGFCC
jgi:hypothetical protein